MLHSLWPGSEIKNNGRDYFFYPLKVNWLLKSSLNLG